jgi:hypothetical protein
MKLDLIKPYNELGVETFAQDFIIWLWDKK